MMERSIIGGLILLATIAIFSLTTSPSISYDPTNVSTRVNITEALPEILAITINNGNSIDLADGTTQGVICNVTVRDYNGHTEISGVNATFFYNATSSWNATDDNNDHYTNSTCIKASITDSITAVWSCGFDIWHYANNGTWDCRATALDAYNFTANGTNNETINPLYAINVSSLIDYGDMAVGDTSTTSETANVTNTGNMNINLSVYGWGGDNLSNSSGDGLAFICDYGNISVDNERFNITDEIWANMLPLSSTSQDIPGLTIAQQTNDSKQVFNSTYWRLYVPPNPFGQCNGTVVFEAELP